MSQRPIAPGFRVDPDGAQRFDPDPLTKDWQRGGEADKLQPGFERMPNGDQRFKGPHDPDVLPTQFPAHDEPPPGFAPNDEGGFEFTGKPGAPLDRPDGGPSDTEAPYFERTEPKPWWGPEEYEWDAHYDGRFED